MNRCDWTQDDELLNAYHDQEWGVPIHDDNKWFEFIVLDAFIGHVVITTQRAIIA